MDLATLKKLEGRGAVHDGIILTQILGHGQVQRPKFTNVALTEPIGFDRVSETDAGFQCYECPYARESDPSPTFMY